MCVPVFVLLGCGMFVFGSFCFLEMCFSRFLQQVISFSLLVTRLGLGVTGAMCEEGPII